jgi:hypothetical protein
MPKTTEEIICETAAGERDGTYKSQKWYSEDEVCKIIGRCLKILGNIDGYKKDGIIRCLQCRRPYKEVDEHTYKPDCECVKDVMVGVG